MTKNIKILLTGMVISIGVLLGVIFFYDSEPIDDIITDTEQTVESLSEEEEDVLEELFVD